MKSLGKQGFIYAYFFLTKTVWPRHDSVEYQIIKQKQSVDNHSIESYFTICDSFSSKVSVTMKENKLFELESNQSTKQVSITMKKK